MCTSDNVIFKLVFSTYTALRNDSFPVSQSFKKRMKGSYFSIGIRTTGLRVIISICWSNVESNNVKVFAGAVNITYKIEYLFSIVVNEYN